MDSLERTWFILGNDGWDAPVGKNPAMVPTFFNQFIKADGNYPATYFRTPGWVHCTKKQWWSSLTMYVLEYFGKDLKQLGLHEAVRATCLGMEVSVRTFYVILELYCPTLRSFFTPVSELGLALHEMWKVSNLLMGSLLYEEYFPCTEELGSWKRKILLYSRHTVS